jgi:hypothetical protein
MTASYVNRRNVLTAWPLFAALAILLGTSTASAVTKTFNVNSGSWATAGNWTPSGVPATTDDVVFQGKRI